MKKTLTILTLLFLGITSHAQTKVKQDDKGNFIQVSNVREKTPDKPTGQTYTDAKGQDYKVYKSVNDKLYIVRTSKSGNEYKQYLKVD
jgi:uncharacterized protein YxeA